MVKISSWLADNLLSILSHQSPLAIAEHASLQALDFRRLQNTGITCKLLRLDALCPWLGGNKIFKLFGHLQNYFKHPCDLPIASFGGAYSNHLYALAAACQILDIPCRGFIRGERPDTPSATLQDLQAMGMSLVFVSRQDYRQRNKAKWLEQLERQHGRHYWVPEGGGGTAGLAGCIAIGQRLAAEANSYVCIASGTGATLAGIALGTPASTNITAFCALKGIASALHTEVKTLQQQYRMETSGFSVHHSDSQAANFCLNDAFHCGGFGRFPAYLQAFTEAFEAETGVLLDPVYTSKMLWGVVNLAEAGHWPEGSQVIAIHTGGVQGRRGTL